MGARLPTSPIKAPRDGGHGGKEVDPPAPISRRFGSLPKIQGLDDAITIPNSGMDEGGALPILDEISVLVSDKLQVVSYKWLSRNFSVSSNVAKRLLEEFVEMHKNEVVAVYSLSGWSKKNPGAYHVTLSSRNNLTEVKKDFMDGCSIQVYSVQACIPKDPAAIWNAEFMQAQELFNQPATVNNCLRDNRYCGVLNLCVKRNIDGKTSNFIPQPKNTVGISKSAVKAPSDPQPQALKDEKNKESGTHEHSDQAAEHAGFNGKVQTKLNNKKNVPKENSTTGGMLANLWGRASTKPKPTTPVEEANTTVVKQEKVSSEVGICSPQEVNCMISDDEEEVRCWWRSNGDSSRKRKVFFDSDEENDDNIVSLSSPDPPKSNSLLNTKSPVVEEKKLDLESEEEKETKIEPKLEKTINLKQEKAVRNPSKVPLKVPAVPTDHDAFGTSTTEKVHHQLPKRLIDDRMNMQADKTASSPSKRKKILKTRVDERGREVTEVLWEGEVADTDQTDKSTAAINVEITGNSRSSLSKAQAVPPASAPTSKIGNKKSMKASGKDAKQGNILSFFKKVS